MSKWIEDWLKIKIGLSERSVRYGKKEGTGEKTTNGKFDTKMNSGWKEWWVREKSKKWDGKRLIVSLCPIESSAGDSRKDTHI